MAGEPWLEAEATRAVIERDGANRAHFLLDKAVQQARAAGATATPAAATAAPSPSTCATAPADLTRQVHC